MKRNYILFVFILFLSCNLFSQVTHFTPKTVPNPKSDTANGWIVDANAYLDREHYIYIDSICNNLKNTVNVELAVVMLPAIDENYYDAFTFCQELFNTWGIGGSAHNTGVLVFFAEESRDIRIHTGQGMEGLLPDGKCDEIIYSALDYLSKGNYQNGISYIVYQIYNELLTTEAQQELLLGWTPKPIKTGPSGLDIYLYICILIGVLFSWRLYSTTKNSAKVQLLHRNKEISNINSYKTISGYLSLLFPIPLFFLYLYTKKLSKGIRNAPARCTSCQKGTMVLQDAANCQALLTSAQLVELRLKSREYDIWKCDNCHTTVVVGYKGEKSNKYNKCTKCGAYTNVFLSDQVLKHATSYSNGLGQRTYRCEHCGDLHTTSYTIPKIVISNGSGSSSRSSGGYSGGSWGGGFSAGGGAGRKF